MSSTYERLRPLFVVALVIGVIGAAPIAFGGATATIDAVAVDDSSVSAGTSLSGYVSFSAQDSNTVYLVLSSDSTYDTGTDKILTFDSSGDLQSWNGLATDSLSDGSYTLYAWDASSGSLSDQDDLSSLQDATTSVTIDGTAPTARVTDSDKTVKATDTIDVTYEASDTGSGVQSATLKFVDGEGNVDKSTSVSSTSDGSTKTASDVSVPSMEDNYTLELEVVDNAGNTDTDTDTSVTVDTTAPNTGLAAPDDGAELTAQPEINVSVSENNAIRSVDVQISRDKSGGGTEYYDGSSWVDSTSSSTWRSASKASSGQYTYNTQSNGITEDGTYTVISRVTDKAGHQTKSTDSYSSAPLPVETAESKITYTVDTHTPVLKDVNVRNNAGYDAAEQGDTVKVSATVTDATSGVGSVTVDASAFGQSAAESLTLDSGDTYSTTFTVADITVSDGPTTLDVTATDEFGQTTTRSDSIVANTSVADVELLNISQEFVGIVADTNTSIRVTASGLTDDNNNTVTVGTTNVSIADTTFEANVSDGSIDTRIDPTKIGNGAATNTSMVVEIEGSDAGANVSVVTLVHEAQGLDEGYQLAGTPMPASDVLFTDVNDVTTYDPAGPASWVEANETRVGQGYYINADSNDARVGYVFKESGSKEDYTQVLENGFNLVSPAVDLNTGDDNITITNDLGYESKPSNVNYHVQDDSGDTTKSPNGASVPPFTQAGTDDSVADNPEVTAYGGYFVEVTDARSDDVFHNIASNGYDITKGS